MKKTYIAVARKLVHPKKIFLHCAKISTNKVHYFGFRSLKGIRTGQLKETGL